MLVACFIRDKNLIGGSAPIFAMMMVGSLLIGQVNSFSSIPLWAYVLLALAPLAMCLGMLPQVERLGRVAYAAVLVPLSLVPLVAAITIALVAEFGGGDAEY